MAPQKQTSNCEGVRIPSAHEKAQHSPNWRQELREAMEEVYRFDRSGETIYRIAYEGKPLYSDPPEPV
jgi:hypothetical protein